MSARVAGLALGSELLGTAIAAECCCGCRMLLELQPLMASFSFISNRFTVLKVCYAYWRLLKSQFEIFASMKVSNPENFHIAGGCNFSVARLTKGRNLLRFFFMYAQVFGLVAVLPSSLPGLDPWLSILRCLWWL